MYYGDRYPLDSLAAMGSSGYLAKPRHTSRIALDKENKAKKAKIRKSIPKMADFGVRKRLPDYTEMAYKEAVSRLRFFLSESYIPSSRSSKVGGASIKNLDESGDEGYDLMPKPRYPLGLYPSLRPYNPVYIPPPLPKRYPFYPKENYKSYTPADVPLSVNINNPDTNNPSGDPSVLNKNPADTELMSFIQKQEEYIEQLERESSYCRDELNNLLGKVKEVISENESLHEKQKNQLISSVMDHRSAGISESDENEGDSTGLDSDTKYLTRKKKSLTRPSSRLEGPNIVFESKISELEAQLTQANIELKKMQDENNDIRFKLSEGIVDSPCLDSFKRQIDNLQRDKTALESQVSKLKFSLDDRKDCDGDLVLKIKKSADMAYQANYDKAQLEMEIRRLKDELERQQGRVRELLGEQTRRVMEERNAVERRYCSQVEQLTSDLTTHWDSATKLQLELERQKREENELKRDLVQKNSQIEDLKMELKNKIASLQADIAQSHADRAAVEEELASARLLLERQQRQAKHDANRLNSEVQSVRQRLDRADVDLVHSRRENLRLMDQIANMEKETNLRSLRPASPKESKEKDLSNKITDLESKHAQTVSELETMVCNQNSLMEKLTAECHLLTSKLDDANHRHKQEMATLQNKLENISLRVQQTPTNYDSNNLITAPSSQNVTFDKTPKVEYAKNDNQHSNQNRPEIIPANVPANEPYTQGPLSDADNYSNLANTGDYNQTYDDNSRAPVLDDSVPQPHPSDNNKEELYKEEHDMEYSNDDHGDRQYAQDYDNTNQQHYTSPNEQEYQQQQQQLQPEQYGDYEATTQEYDPTQQYVDPSQQYVDPSQQYVDPTTQQYVDPTQQYDPSQYADPSQGYVDPSQYADPSQQYVEPSQ